MEKHLNKKQKLETDLNPNNGYIESLLKSKSYSLIISKYTGRDTDYFDLSMYRILKLLYNDEELFELGVKHLILGLKFDTVQINKLYEFIKLNGLGEYEFMHKYILKTPDYVFKEIFYFKEINGRTTNNVFTKNWRVRLNEKVFVVKYEQYIKPIFKLKPTQPDQILLKIPNGLSRPDIHTQILLLSRWHIIGIDNYEHNIFNFYFNKIHDCVDKVIFYPHLEIEINVVNKLIETCNDANIKNIGNSILTHTYLYSNWEKIYFGGSIKNYSSTNSLTNTYTYIQK